MSALASAPAEHGLYLTRTADKGQRKLDKPLREKLRDAMMAIVKDPEAKGEKLTSPLTNVYSHHVKYQGKEFRIAYTVNHETQTVVVLLIGPHENFYRSLKNMLYAS